MMKNSSDAYDRFERRFRTRFEHRTDYDLVLIYQEADAAMAAMETASEKRDKAAGYQGYQVDFAMRTDAEIIETLNELYEEWEDVGFLISTRGFYRGGPVYYEH